MWHTARLSNLLPSSKLIAMTTEPQQGTERRGGIPADSFSNRLMLARAHAGHLSIREAADLCDLGRGAWTNWEKGARPADIIDIATVVADKLGVDRDWLLFGGQLAEAESRQSRRIRSVKEPYISDGDHLTSRGERPTRTSPVRQPRMDSRRPVSAIPATRRRPQAV